MAMRDRLGPTAWREWLWSQIGYQPIPTARQFHEGTLPTGETAQIKFEIGGEQAGKSFSAAMEVLTRAVATPLPQLVWIIAATYDQARQEMGYLAEACYTLGWVAKFNNPDSKSLAWSLRLHTGLEIVTLSAADEMKIAGRAPDGILLVEAGQVPYSVYQRCRGRIAPKNGWLCVNGTLEKGNRWFPQLADKFELPNAERAGVWRLPTWENHFLYPGGYDDPKIVALRAANGEDYVRERFGGQTVPPRELVFGLFSVAKHCRPIQYGGARPPLTDTQTVYLEEGTPLEVWIDPGHGASAYAVLCGYVDRSSGTVYILDELYLHGLRTSRVIQEAARRPWWKYVTKGVMDRAGRQLHGEQTEQEIWQASPAEGGAGLPIETSLAVVPVLGGNLRIDALLDESTVDHRVHLTIDPGRCPKLIWELSEAYRYPTDAQGAPIQGQNPVDQDNHAVAALRYGCWARFGATGRARGASVRKASPYRPPWRVA